MHLNWQLGLSCKLEQRGGMDSREDWRALYTQVQYVSAAQFRQQYMQHNQPVVLPHLTSTWRSYHEWRIGDKQQAIEQREQSGLASYPALQVLLRLAQALVQSRLPDAPISPCPASSSSSSSPSSLSALLHHIEEEKPSRPNFDHLIEQFGKDTVCASLVFTPYFSAHLTEPMQLSAYLLSWQQGAYKHCKRDELRYVKDYHLALENPEYGAYTVPPHFAEDWLNQAHLSSSSSSSSSIPILSTDDYRFCYMGAQGTWTSFHRDVFNSYSWSANIVGRKLWIMLSPDYKQLLEDEHGTLLYDVFSLLKSADWNTWPTGSPALSPCSSSSPSLSPYQYSAFIQQEGETVFVPSGWFHQVHNLDDCISLNHNWMNGYCVRSVYTYFLERWIAAQRAVSGFNHTSSSSSSSSLLSSSHASTSASTSPSVPASTSVSLPTSSLSSTFLTDSILLSSAHQIFRVDVGMDWRELGRFLRGQLERCERLMEEERESKEEKEDNMTDYYALSIQSLQWILNDLSPLLSLLDTLQLQESHGGEQRISDKES